MKELSIEEKAKRYDEAIEKLHEIITMDNKPVNPKEIGKYLFPELKESEDERIREQVVYAINQLHVCECTKNKLRAWLEKQGETFTKKDIDDAYLKGVCDTKHELEKQDEQKPAWSEEDEKNINFLCELLTDLQVKSTENEIKYGTNSHSKYYHDTKDWLKSLKDRYTWKPSSEQMRVLDLAIRCGINRGTTEETTLVSLFNDLKKLKL